MGDPVLASTVYRDLSRCATIPYATLWPQTNTNGIRIVQMIQIQGIEEGSNGEPSLKMIRSGNCTDRKCAKAIDKGHFSCRQLQVL